MWRVALAGVRNGFVQKGPGLAVVSGFPSLDPATTWLTEFSPPNCRQEFMGREADCRGHDGIAGGLRADVRQQLPCLGTIGRLHADNASFAVVAFRRRQEELAVSRAVDDVVGAGSDPFLIEEGEPKRTFPRSA